MTEPSSKTPDDEQPTGSFDAVGEPTAPAVDPELPPPGAPADATGGDVVAQIERLAQDRPEALIGGAFAIGFALAMVVRRIVR
ncbi:MAG: hypothetical protein Q7T55_26355 [Solirubrobacteraceae bacterium]|nr:hypothetical protein [Solirubrobacteraceae bacterium]